MADIIVGSIVFLGIAIAAYKIYKTKKSGKNSCGCGGSCSGCGDSCH